MTNPDLGPRSSSDNAFKARARLHQSRFRLQVLGHQAYRGYGSRLTPDAALAGENFFHRWPGVMDAVEKRFGVADKKLCWDMLASDHIPFNFFIPMRSQPWAHELVRDWVGPTAAKITGIEIEWAPAPAANFLDDSTSFDAYITYDAQDGTRGAIGIETKFTEGPYSWGAAEKLRMSQDDSPYLRVNRESGAYVDGAVEKLRTPKLKQLWRNQLLGEAMLQRRVVGADRPDRRPRVRARAVRPLRADRHPHGDRHHRRRPRDRRPLPDDARSRSARRHVRGARHQLRCKPATAFAWLARVVRAGGAPRAAVCAMTRRGSAPPPTFGTASTSRRAR